MFFLLGMSPGFYVPALTNILIARGLDSVWVQWAWLAGPVASLLSPVSVLFKATMPRIYAFIGVSIVSKKFSQNAIVFIL